MATTIKATTTTTRKAPAAPIAKAAPAAPAAPAPRAPAPPRMPTAATAPTPPTAPTAPTAPTDKARREDKRATRAARDSFIATSNAPAALRALASVLAPRPERDDLLTLGGADWREPWAGVIVTLAPVDDGETPIVSPMRAIVSYPGAADPNGAEAAHAEAAGYVALWDARGVTDAAGAPYRVRDGGPAYVTTLLGYVREAAFNGAVTAAGDDARAALLPDVMLAPHVAAPTRPAVPAAPAPVAPAAPISPAATVKPPARPVPPARAR